MSERGTNSLILNLNPGYLPLITPGNTARVTAAMNALPSSKSTVEGFILYSYMKKTRRQA